MENFKTYIFLLVRTQAWPPWALSEKALHWWLDSFIFSLPCPPAPLPLSQGGKKENRAGGGRKNPKEKAVLGGKEGGAAGKWQAGALEAGGSITSSPPPRPGLLSRPLATVLLSVTQLPSGKQKWSSFSPRGSKTSFSIPLMGANIYRKSGGTQRPKHQEDVIALVVGRMNPDSSLQSHQVLSPAQKSGPKEIVLAPSHMVYQ